MQVIVKTKASARTGVSSASWMRPMESCPRRREIQLDATPYLLPSVKSLNYVPNLGQELDLLLLWGQIFSSFCPLHLGMKFRLSKLQLS